MTLPQQFGPYVLLKSLGGGSQGDVHLASDGRSLVVVKRMAPQLIGRPILTARFRHEADIARAVESPRVVKVFDVGRVGDRFFTVMELVPGWSLDRVLSDLLKSRARVPVGALVQVAIDALEGLGALHSAVDDEGRPLSIVHRDVVAQELDAHR